MCRSSCTKWNRALRQEIIILSINTVQLFKDSEPTSSYFKFAKKRTLPQALSCKLSESFQDPFFTNKEIQRFKT